MNKKTLALSAGLLALSIFTALNYTNCSGFSSSSNAGVTSSSVPSSSTFILPPTGNNVMPVTLGGYGNEPVISLTICQRGTTNCVTVSNLLLDSGSSGVRIFSSALNANFMNSLAGGTTGECVSYGDNSVQWGNVAVADVQLGQEKASSVPIEIVNSSFSDGGRQCMSDLTSFYIDQGYISEGTSCPVTTTSAESNDPGSAQSGCPFFDSPASYYNGIVGVNFLEQDCGEGCATFSDNELYYSCSGTNCASTAMPVTSQVSNPIGFLPIDNNGIVLEFPNAPTIGYETTVAGYAILGIGTQANNIPGAVTALAADPNISDTCYSWFQTSWGGSTICGFLDSGSQALSFPNLTTAAISVDPNSGAYDPIAPLVLTATNIGYNGNSILTQFTVANTEAELQSNYVVNDIGVEDTSGPIDGSFDWGFPAFMGRTVYVGLEGTTSSLGTGLYWAY